MKTYNYGIDLMLPLQTDKEIIFNEAQSTIDNFCNSSIIDFINDLPPNPEVGKKYILNTGEKANYIYFCNNLSKGWQLLKPKSGMVIFILQEKSFFIFDTGRWNRVQAGHGNAGSPSSGIIQPNERFEGISDRFEVPANSQYLYLYLNDNCTIELKDLKSRQLTFILKQNYQNAKNIYWPGNILWKNNQPHILTQTLNSIDIIKLYHLIESQHFLAEIVGQDYKF